MLRAIQTNPNTNIMRQMATLQDYSGMGPNLARTNALKNKQNYEEAGRKLRVYWACADQPLLVVSVDQRAV